MEITFELLPQAVTALTNEVREIKRLLLEKSNEPQPEPDRWFDLNELVEYDPEKRTKPTFYGYIGQKVIPYHKRGKKLLFLKSEIDTWLMQGKRKTFAETASEADTYINEKGPSNGR
jgi:predicted DNA-binding transcriptional regulator AlpA